MIAQQTQNDHNRCIYNINNRSAELILNNEIIERNKTFHL